MQAIAPCLAEYTTVSMRLALGSTFLAAVTDRCGLWGPPGTRNVAWGNFDTFLAYAAQLNPYLPAAWIPMVGWGVTLAEAACGLALIVGFQTRKVAVGSGLLLVAFALGMALGVGVKTPFNSSVFSAAAGAFLLATRSHDPVSMERWCDRQTRQGTRHQQASASTTSATGRACGGMRSMGSRTPVQPSVGARLSPSPAYGRWWG
jgi:uncharacterized membrane protein YphA (DoxX/SURF4 family)